MPSRWLDLLANMAIVTASIATLSACVVRYIALILRPVIGLNMVAMGKLRYRRAAILVK